MIIKRFVTPGLSINSYFVFDEDSRQGVMIDPTRQVEFYLASAFKENVEIVAIFETHVHADFISGANELKAALHGKPSIYCSGMGGEEWTPKYADHIVKDLDSVQVGSMRFQALHTPGHTFEHLIWLAFDEKRNSHIPEVAFTGDMLFVGSIGRPDLIGDQQTEELLARQLYRSVFGAVHSLPDLIEIYPGHGAGSMCGKGISGRDTSTIGYEKRCNPWLISQNFEEWHKQLLKGISKAPRYFQRIKNINLTGINAQASYQTMPQPLTLDEVRGKHAHCLVVDVRSGEEFTLRHLKDSVNVPFGHAFTLWAGIALPDDMEIVIVINSFGEALPVIEALRLIGINHVVGVCSAEKWDQDDALLVSLPAVDVDKLNKDLAKYFVLDVRTPTEWNEMHLRDSHHIELTEVLHAMDKLPRNQPIAVICRTGTRASLVSSSLIKYGFNNVFNVIGGITAWEKKGYAVIKN